MSNQALNILSGQAILSPKRCSRCRKLKSTTEFWKNSGAHDGFHTYCKDCLRAARLRTVDRTQKKIQSHRYYKNNSQHVKDRIRDYRAKNRSSRTAQNKVAYAVRHGKLKPCPCEVCGQVKAESHHDDYSKALSVRWLCRIHHAEYHVRQRGELEFLRMRQEDRRLLEQYGIDAGLMRDSERAERGQGK